MSSLLDGLAEGDVLPVVDEQRVVLVVEDYVVDGGEAQRTHGVAAITGWVDVEVLTAGGREGGREGGRLILQVCTCVSVSAVKSGAYTAAANAPK